MDDDYEEEATQQATQQLPDHGGLAPSESLGQDFRDVICFLHPCSPAAHKVVRDAAATNPSLTARLPVPSEIDNSDSELTEEEKQRRANLTAIDLVLRYHPGPRDPLMGYLFGRNPMKCDVVMLETSKQRRISNQHFRIYVNVKGALMLEDMSTNGTWVDDKRLSPDSEHGRKRVLGAGAIVHICPGRIMDELIRFVVRIPKASGQGFRTAVNRDDSSLIKGLDLNPGQFLPPPTYGQNPALMRSPQRNQAAIQRNPRLAAKNHEISLHVQRPLAGRPRGQNVPLEMDTHTAHQEIKSAWPGDADYSMNEQIGKGAFASVNKAFERRTGEVVAVKVIAKRTFANQIGTERSGVKKEVNILEQLIHPNIVRYIRHYEDNTHICLVMELIEHGDLSNYLQEHTYMPEGTTKEVTMQVLRGIEYIHAMGISHRDLKPDNILIANKDPILVKISDFGLAKMVNNEETFLKTFCGTMLYLAPEVFPGYMTVLMDQANHDGPTKRKRAPNDDHAGRRVKGRQHRRPYNQAVDMWSLGCVVYALLCGSPPFEGKNQDEMCRLVVRGEFDIQRLKHYVGYQNDDCVDFLRRLLQVRPEMRMMETEAMRHPWIYTESSYESFMEYGEDEVRGVIYDQEGRAIAQNGGFMGMMQDDDDDEESDEDVQPTPRPPRQTIVRDFVNKELKGSMSQVRLNNMQEPCPSRSPASSSSPVSGEDAFDIAAHSANEFSQPQSTGLSVIDRDIGRGKLPVLKFRGDSEVLPEGLSMFGGEFNPEINPNNLQAPEVSQVASSGALGRTPGPSASPDLEDAGNTSLNGAESRLNKLDLITANGTPSPFTTPPPPELPSANSFSFADEPAAVANFSPDSLKSPVTSHPTTAIRDPQEQSQLARRLNGQIPQPQTPARIAPLLLPRPTPSDDHLPPTQILPSQTPDQSFTRPYAPWGRFIMLPDSIPMDGVQTPILFMDQVIYIGRSNACTHRPSDPRISKHHLAIQIHHPNKEHQSDPRESTLEQGWRPQEDMVVTFMVNGRSGVTVNGKKYAVSQMGMLCDGDEVVLFKDPIRGEMMGGKVELYVGRVRPEDRAAVSEIGRY